MLQKKNNKKIKNKNKNNASTKLANSLDRTSQI
jgi:hypothetical protein